MLPQRYTSQVARLAGASRNISRALVHLLLTGFVFRIQTTKPKVMSGFVFKKRKKISSDAESDDSSKVKRK